METNIYSLFPTPVYFSKLNRKLTNKELSFIDKTKLDVYKNEGNTTSNDSYILNHEEFKELKTDLELKIQDYFNKIILPKNNLTPYITQSWVNFTETNQFHHRHNHHNSFLSGVFYINCNEKFDKIKFYSDKFRFIEFDYKEFNLWNSGTWIFPIKTGDVVLFPSSLDHEV